MSVLSEIRSLPFLKAHDNIKLVNRAKVEKLLKADQEKLKPLMAHLQPENRPILKIMSGVDAHAYAFAVTEYFEELDKRIGHQENYVCVPRKKLSDLMGKRPKCVYDDGEMPTDPEMHEWWDWAKSVEELLQPSTTEKGEKK